MTFEFNIATITTETLAFNFGNGPQLTYLQLWSQMANQQMVGNTTDPLNWWSLNSQGLVMELVNSNDRYSEYLFKYATVDGIDDSDQIFVNDINGIYNYRLNKFTSNFLWNTNQNLYNLEPSLWSQPGSLVEVPIQEGVIKIKNVEPTQSPNKITYQSSNETRQGYVFLTNNSL